MTGCRAISSFMGIPILALAITPSFCRNPVLYSELTLCSIAKNTISEEETQCLQTWGLNSYKELQSTKESWKWERCSSPEKSTATSCPVQIGCSWKRYMHRAFYIIILFRNLYAYTYICMHAMIINKEQVMDLKKRRSL